MRSNLSPIFLSFLTWITSILQLSPHSKTRYHNQTSTQNVFTSLPPPLTPKRTHRRGRPTTHRDHGPALPPADKQTTIRTPADRPANARCEFHTVVGSALLGNLYGQQAHDRPPATKVHSSPHNPHTITHAPAQNPMPLPPKNPLPHSRARGGDTSRGGSNGSHAPALRL